MEGTTLAHFRILAKIGEGGMGVVYRAEDENLRRPVALKVLPPDVIANEERRKRFLREARAAAAIPHPNIATIYEIGEADGVVFIAMELVEGATLRGRIGRGPLTIKDSLDIALQIAEGLARAHRSHIVHRDLKPENIAITPGGQVKILDFGLAKLLQESDDGKHHDLTHVRTISGEMTEAGKILGTTSYMSPEQARGEVVDARSDIFSLGSVLYEMVTGRAAFRGRTSTDILSAIVRDQPPAPAEINPSVPPTLQRIIGECLEKDPNDRYQHADQLAVDLRKLIRSTDSDVRPSGAASWLDSAASRDSWFGRLKSRAHRRVVIGILACLLLAAGFSIWQVLKPAPSFDNREGIILADFENRTGHAAFDTAVRDAFEQLLSLSTSVNVIRGDGLKSILGVRSEDRLPTLDRRTVERSCSGGKCAFIVGRIAPDSGSFRLRVDLFRPGSNTPIFSQSAAVRSEQDCLEVLHNIAIDLRRAAGEAPGAIALTTGPTTRSLAAFQAYASGELEAESGRSDVALGLHRRALAIDPEFVDAYTSLCYDYANVGEWQASRASAEQVYRRSSRLPERSRLMAEILYLDTQYDHAREIELLKSYRRLYPYDQVAANNLGWLYMFALEDHVAAEPHFRAAYELRPTLLNLDMLTVSLVVRSNGDAIARVAQDYRRRTGLEPAQAILWALALGSDRKAMLQAVDRYERDGTLSRSQAAERRGWAHEKAGRFRDTLRMQEIVRREDLKQQGESNFGACRMMWLKMRLSRPAMLSSEELARAARSPLWLRWWAIVAVEAKVAEPLATLIAKFEELERDTQSPFVHQELQFARGCLAFVRGDLKAARRLIEPLAENTEVPHRFHVLGRLYEAQRMWPEAATQYEAVVNNPSLIASLWPALWNLDRFRLAQTYERLGDTARARQLYERFAADWKDGDPDIPELVNARQRLALLGSGTSSRLRTSPR